MDFAFSDIVGNPMKMDIVGAVSRTAIIFELSSKLSFSAFGFLTNMNMVLFCSSAP